MAGELNQPSIAMPAETSPALTQQILAALKDPECKFLDGHFVNATTTLNYVGSTASLNRLITNLTECDGIEVVVTFVKGEPSGPSWSINHSGWGGAKSFGIQINLAASALDLGQLAITVARLRLAYPRSALYSPPVTYGASTLQNRRTPLGNTVSCLVRSSVVPARLCQGRG
jgi:hypothetical protein